jgi:hypothetical protein
MHLFISKYEVGMLILEEHQIQEGTYHYYKLHNNYEMLQNVRYQDALQAFI